MQNSNDLFDLRVAIGNKIKNQMEQQAISKAELCRETGMSRPTLDKMLSGSITNKTNYDKHISKIMDCCQTAHCGRCQPHFDFGVIASPIVPYRNLPQTLDGMTSDCRSFV